VAVDKENFVDVLEKLLVDCGEMEGNLRGVAVVGFVRHESLEPRKKVVASSLERERTLVLTK